MIIYSNAKYDKEICKGKKVKGEVYTVWYRECQPLQLTSLLTPVTEPVHLGAMLTPRGAHNPATI